MSFLVSAHELARLLEAGGTRVLDVHFALGGPPSIELYAAGHIPGAPHLPLEPALAGPAGERGRHPLPDPQVLQEHLRRCGVDDDSSIVVYDQQTSLAAGRAWWILRWAGLTDVRVLDGGLAAWVAAGFPVASASPAPMATVQADATQGLGGAEGRGTVTVRPGSLPVLELADVPRVAADGILVDVRAPERYRGEVEPIDSVAGHIPGAVNLPMGLMQHGDGTFRSPDEIRGLAAEAGIDGSTVVATSCGSGVTASQMVLALATAGLDATPYIGSWSEWITDPERPVATVTG